MTGNTLCIQNFPILVRNWRCWLQFLLSQPRHNFRGRLREQASVGSGMRIRIEPNFASSLPSFGIWYVGTMTGSRHATCDAGRLHVGMDIHFGIAPKCQSHRENQEHDCECLNRRSDHGAFSLAKNRSTSANFMAAESIIPTEAEFLGGSLW